MIPGDNQNPWATPSGGNAAFLNPNRPAIADLALAALKEKGESKKKRIWFTFPSFNQDRSLFFLTRKNPIRRHCLNIVDSKPFDIFILLSILANCTALSINHPYPDNDSNNLNEILDKVEKAFVFIFLTESVLKIIAYGFIFHPNAYLKSFWNILDFSIVIIGVLSTILEDTNIDVKSLRAFRILRPLRLVSSLPSLQVVLNSILTALIPLLHIGLLVIFVIILYSIIGIELFNGKLHKTCYRNVSNRWIIMDDPIVCTDANSSFAGFSCKIVGPDYVCRDLNNINRWPGPNSGITSFDNFFYAMLTVFVCITMEGWTDVGYWISNAEGSVYPWVYFVSLILIGSFFVMNLVLGVLSGEFSKEKEKIDRKELFRKERQEKREQQDYIGYKEWIEIAEEISDSDDESYSSSSMESNRVEDEAFSHIEEVAKTRCHSTLKKLRKFRKRTRRIIIAFLNSRQCFILIIVLVFLNTVVLTTEHHGQPEWLDRFQTFANNIFVSLFTIEMIIKMNAFGFQDYFSKMFNRFDFIIVICSVTEMLFTKTEILPAMGISVLRCARLLRIFKLTHYWEALRSLVSKLLKSVHSIASLLLLLFLFILIFSLLGMQTFGGKFNFKDKEKPRANFDGVVQAMLTVFQILTGEDWNAVMYDGMKAYENEKVLWSFMIVLYFVILFICGNYILLNVFLAIAVDNLNDENDDEEDEERKAKEAANADTEADGAENGEEEKNPMRHIKPKTTGADYTNFTEMTYEEMFAEDEDELNGDLNAKANAENAPQDSKVIPPYTSFFIFRDDNKFRVFCHNIICSSYFGNIILACILVSSILLAAEDPVNSNSSRNKILNYFDYFFTTVFTIEITLKVISYGLILHEGAFCRSLFNLLDLIVVCVALVSFLLDKSSISVVKILRVLRVLRPLRAINRAKGLKRVVQCVIVAVKSIGNIMLVTFLLMFMFAVMGVQLFKGRFSLCNDRSKRTQEECQGFFINYEGEPEKVARIWRNNDFHFDNVGQALLSLFATSTFEGWPDLLWLAIDSNKENYGPLTNYRKIVSLFFIIYIIIIAFFMVNIFVGFVIVTFQREGEAEYKYCELDKNQRKCIEYALKARPRRRYIPKGHLQYRIWSIVVSKKFEYFIFGAILINTFMMCLRHDNASQTVVDIMDYTNYIFTVIFTLEFILKLSAFSIRHYFGDPLNVLDFILVIGSLVDIIIILVQGADDTFARLDPKYYRFFRLLRVMRLIKLLNKEESIRKLLWTFVKSIQALPYVALLIAMIFFIYAVIGMQLFGKIEMKPDNDEDAVITKSNNFSSFLWALLVLFRSSTGESWQKIMMACKADQKCGPENKGDTCGSNIAFVYFTSFYFLCSFLIINLFVAVIMDNFDYLTRDWSILGPHHLDEFVTKWAEYDPEAKGRVKHIEVGTMLGKINPPLGFGSMCPHTRACHKLVRMNMPLQSDGTVFFNATLFALVRRNLKIKVPDDGKDKDKSLDQLNEELRAVIRRIWKRTSPKLLDQIIPPKDSDVVTVGKFYATFLIQNWFRDWQKRKMVRKDTRYIPQILAGDRSMPHQPTIGGLPRKCSSDLTGDELKRGSNKRETPGGIIGRTLSEWTRRQSSKNTSNRRELTDPFYKSGQQYIEPVTLNVPTNLHVAHPSVMAVAQSNQTALKSNESNQRSEKNKNKDETSNDPNAMNGIMNFLWGNQQKQQDNLAVNNNGKPNGTTNNEDELIMARMMFAAARRESKKFQNMM